MSNCVLDGEDYCYECEVGFTQRNGRCVQPSKNKNLQHDNNNNNDGNDNNENDLTINIMSST